MESSCTRGVLLDRRYDLPDRSLLTRDHVLRLRSLRTAGSRSGFLDWKGDDPLRGWVQVREELSTPVDDPEVLANILESSGIS